MTQSLDLPNSFKSSENSSPLSAFIVYVKIIHVSPAVFLTTKAKCFCLESAYGMISFSIILFISQPTCAEVHPDVNAPFQPQGSTPQLCTLSCIMLQWSSHYTIHNFKDPWRLCSSDTHSTFFPVQHISKTIKKTVLRTSKTESQVWKTPL